MVEKNPTMMINSRSELYGACRHNPRFHRYYNSTCERTDEANGQKESPIKKRSNIKAKDNPNENWWSKINGIIIDGIIICPTVPMPVEID